MRAGKLRHRLVFKSRDVGEDTAGQPVKTWSTFKTRWGSVESVAGSEKLAAAKTISETTHIVELRYTEGITAQMRMEHRDVVYTLHNVRDPDGRRVSLLIEASTGVSDNE